MKNPLADRAFGLGVWTWLQIVEGEADRLSDGGQVALESLREDLEKMARDREFTGMANL